MATFTVLSAKGSPGVSTLAVGLALAWAGAAPGRKALAVDADPIGGDFAAGVLGGAARVHRQDPVTGAQTAGRHPLRWQRDRDQDLSGSRCPRRLDQLRGEQHPRNQTRGRDHPGNRCAIDGGPRADTGVQRNPGDRDVICGQDVAVRHLLPDDQHLVTLTGLPDEPDHRQRPDGCQQRAGRDDPGPAATTNRREDWDVTRGCGSRGNGLSAHPGSPGSGGGGLAAVVVPAEHPPCASSTAAPGRGRVADLAPGSRRRVRFLPFSRQMHVSGLSM